MRRVLAALALVVALVTSGCATAPLQQRLTGALAHQFTTGGAVLSYCASAPVEAWTPQLRRVVVVVHGLDRNACGMRQAAVDALGGEPDDTVVVAPHFATSVDAVTGGHVWGTMAWPAGEESNAGLSSYAALDALVASFGDRSVTLVGFSGGGQFTNRYAAVSSTTLDSYVVVNPSTYLWFTPDRPGPTASCPGYDRWRYGLDHRNRYASRLSIGQIERQYAARHVTYLIGTADDDPRSSSLDRTCGAMAQGPNREERALNYHRHRSDVFGAQVAARQPFVLVPGVGHDGRAMLTSPSGAATLRG